jgi:hypothetical protein
MQSLTGIFFADKKEYTKSFIQERFKRAGEIKHIFF